MRIAPGALVALGLGVGLPVVVGLAPGVAHAQSENKAAAEAAFRQGRDLLARGEYVAACAAFRSSQELDPQLGTQYNLGLCYEKGGMLASAWGELTDLAARDTNNARKKDAAKRARALEPRLVKVLLVVRGSTPGLVVKRDGKDVTPIVGVATPVDPGSTVIEATAEGYEPFTLETAIIGEGTTVTLEIPALTALPPPPVDDTPPPVDDTPPVVVEKPRPIDLDPGAGRRKLGLVLGGVGVGGLVVGATFGVLAMRANQDASDECGGDVGDCRGDIGLAQDSIDSARSKGTIATIAVGVGAAAVVTGAVLYLTAPARRGPVERAALVPIATPSQLGAAVIGRF